MTIEERKLLTDIEEAILSIDQHLEGKRIFEEYINNKTKRRAVERELEIIGEAMTKLLKISPDISITHGRVIVGLRNRVIHAYDTVDETIIWKIVMKDLPVLLTEVQNLLSHNIQ
jgi:uncharacterized protein with HEPN domain